MAAMMDRPPGPEEDDPDTSDEQYVDIDHGVPSDEQLRLEQRKQDVAVKPAYFPMQESLADIVVSRIEDILWLYQDQKELSYFTNFVFQIYTARNNMLQRQTLQRVMDARAECFAKKFYDDKEYLQFKATKRVLKYQKCIAEEERIEELKKRVKEEPKTLFLIVADEAHWGFGNKTDKEGSAANNAYVNCWNNDHKNVIVLLVTATAFNLKTADARLNVKQEAALVNPAKSAASVAQSVQVDETGDAHPQTNDRSKLHLVTKAERGVGQYDFTETKDRVQGSVKQLRTLHVVRWSEGHQDLIREGMAVKLRLPNSVNVEVRWLSIDDNYAETGLRNVTSTENYEEAVELILEGSTKDSVTISCVVNSLKYQLVAIIGSKTSRKNEHLGFIRCGESPPLSKDSKLHKAFIIHMNCGEDVIMLEISDDNNLYFHYNKSKNYLKLLKRLGKDAGHTELPLYAKENLFILEYFRPKENLDPGYQYLSLNFYFNTMRNTEPVEQLLRCGDEDTVKFLKKFAKKTEEDRRDDYLAADYAYYILLVEDIRKFSLGTCSIVGLMQNQDPGIRSYREMRASKIEKFKECLRKVKASDVKPIKAKIFTALLDHKSQVLLDRFKSLASDRYLRKNDHFDECKEELFSTIVEGLFHMSDEHLQETVQILEDFLTKIDFEDTVLRAFSEYIRDFESVKATCLNKSETCKIINTVIRDVSEGIGLDGKMVVVRVKGVAKGDNSKTESKTKVDPKANSPGNRFYSTLCFARQVASSDHSFKFEVIRDFDSFKISDLMSQGVEAPKFRIHRRLQPERCEYVDPKTLSRCSVGEDGEPCSNYQPLTVSLPLRCCRCDHVHRDSSRDQPDRCEHVDPVTGQICDRECDEYQAIQPLTCQHCHHVHKEINDYNDCNRLPCILILVNKGRLGDTFPESFFAMDLRLSFSDALPHLSTFMQELGRLCRYNKKYQSQIDTLPYALISPFLEKKLLDGLNDYAVLYGIFVKEQKIDAHVAPQKKGQKKKEVTCDQNEDDVVEARDTHHQGHFQPAKTNADRGNVGKHNYRLLLEAEPQIGKTGVYLKTISLLRQRICGEERLEEVEDNDPESEDEQGAEDEEPTVELAETWRYPYWKDMKQQRYPKQFSHGKYDATAGSKEIETKERAIIFNQSKNTKTKPKKSKVDLEKLQTYCFNDPSHISCPICRSHSNRKEFTTSIEDIGDVKVSVPNTIAYKPFLKFFDNTDPHIMDSMDVGSMSMDHGSEDLATPASRTLKTWIFTPSYKRAKEACLNLRHTMAKLDGQNCYHLHFVVVRKEDFDAYCQIWGGSHAVVQLPNKMGDDCVTRGIGFARLFIQKFAIHFLQRHIFMADDNIKRVQEIVTEKVNGTEIVKRIEGALEMKVVPLYDVLRHLEQQFIDDNPVSGSIPGDFEPCPEGNGGILEQYCGPKWYYAVLGILKDRKGIRRIKKPFKKTNSYSLNLLNLDALQEQNLFYKPQPSREDVDLYKECNDKSLWVCKYSRFLMQKLHLKSHIVHNVFVWKEDAAILNRYKKLKKPKGTSSIEVLRKWIVLNHPTSRVETKIPKGAYWYSKKDFTACVPVLKHCKLGKTHIVLYLETGIDLLGRYFETTQGIGGYREHLIMVTVTWCSNNCLLSKMTLRTMVDRIFTEVRQFEVITSHNIQYFKVQYILLYINGKIRKPVDDEMQPNTELKERVKRYDRILQANAREQKEEAMDTSTHSNDAGSVSAIDPVPLPTNITLQSALDPPGASDEGSSSVASKKIPSLQDNQVMNAEEPMELDDLGATPGLSSEQDTGMINKQVDDISAIPGPSLEQNTGMVAESLSPVRTREESIETDFPASKKIKLDEKNSQLGPSTSSEATEMAQNIPDSPARVGNVSSSSDDKQDEAEDWGSMSDSELLFHVERIERELGLVPDEQMADDLVAAELGAGQERESPPENRRLVRILRSCSLDEDRPRQSEDDAPGLEDSETTNMDSINEVEDSACGTIGDHLPAVVEDSDAVDPLTAMQDRDPWGPVDDTDLLHMDDTSSPHMDEVSSDESESLFAHTIPTRTRPLAETVEEVIEISDDSDGEPERPRGDVGPGVAESLHSLDDVGSVDNFMSLMAETGPASEHHSGSHRDDPPRTRHERLTTPNQGSLQVKNTERIGFEDVTSLLQGVNHVNTISRTDHENVTAPQQRIAPANTTSVSAHESVTPSNQRVVSNTPKIPQKSMTLPSQSLFNNPQKTAQESETTQNQSGFNNYPSTGHESGTSPSQRVVQANTIPRTGRESEKPPKHRVGDNTQRTSKKSLPLPCQSVFNGNSRTAHESGTTPNQRVGQANTIPKTAHESMTLSKHRVGNNTQKTSRKSLSLPYQSVFSTPRSANESGTSPNQRVVQANTIPKTDHKSLTSSNQRVVNNTQRALPDQSVFKCVTPPNQRVDNITPRPLPNQSVFSSVSPPNQSVVNNTQRFALVTPPNQVNNVSRTAYENESRASQRGSLVNRVLGSSVLQNSTTGSKRQGLHTSSNTFGKKDARVKKPPSDSDDENYGDVATWRRGNNNSASFNSQADLATESQSRPIMSQNHSAMSHGASSAPSQGASQTLADPKPPGQAPRPTDMGTQGVEPSTDQSTQGVEPSTDQSTQGVEPSTDMGTQGVEPSTDQSTQDVEPPTD